MTDESTISLRILKSTWGIAIDLTACLTDNSKPSQYYITDRIGFSISSLGFKLSEQEILMLIGGLRWVAVDVESKIEGDKSIAIQLVRAVFADTDFQPEGFYYAIATWAANYFHFTLPDYEVTFDKNENKYKFPDIELRAEN